MTFHKLTHGIEKEPYASISKKWYKNLEILPTFGKCRKKQKLMRKSFTRQVRNQLDTKWDTDFPRLKNRVKTIRYISKVNVKAKIFPHDYELCF